MEARSRLDPFKETRVDTNETSFGLELSKDNGWVFLFPRDDIGGIKPIDFAPIMGIREVDPHPHYFEKADSVNRFSSRIFSFPAKLYPCGIFTPFIVFILFLFDYHLLIQITVCN